MIGLTVTRMSNDNDKKPTVLGYEPGPYTRKFTKTIELSPLKFTVTEDESSSHVPPPEVIPPAPCGCGGGGGGASASMLDALFSLFRGYASQAAQAASAASAGGGEDPGSGEPEH